MRMSDNGTIPPLRHGDRLTRGVRAAVTTPCPHLNNAELIEGVVFMLPSPVRWRHHSKPHGQLITWLGNYEAATPGVEHGDNASRTP